MSRLSLDDPDELLRAAAAVRRHADSLADVRTQATKAASDAYQHLVEVVRLLTARLASAEAALAACDPDSAAHSMARARVIRLRERLAQATAVEAQGRHEVESLGRALSTHARQTATRTSELATVLVQIHRGVEGTSGLLSSLGGPSSLLGGSAGPGGAAVSTPRAEEPTAPAQCGDTDTSLVPLSAIRDPDAELPPREFLHMSETDMRSALLLLDARVLPAVLAGGTRDDMVELDRQRGLAGTSVNHASVFDGFFRSTAVTLSSNGDGTFSVVNGYHRIWVAKQLGIDALPGRIVGSP